MAKKNNYYDSKHMTISNDMFKVDIVILINGSESQNRLWLKKLLGENYSDFDIDELSGWDDKTVEGRMIPFNGGFIVLLKAKKDRFIRLMANIVHEMTHVTHYLLRDRRIPLNMDTEEVYTYMTENLVEQTLNKLYS